MKGLMHYLRCFQLTLICVSYVQSLSGALDTSQAAPSEEVKEFSAIVQRYEEALKQNPHDLKLILAVADVYYALKQWNKAIEYYRLGLHLDPKNVKIKTSLALASLNNSDIDTSEALLNEVLLQDPSNLDALTGLGRIAALTHHYEKAQHLFQQVLLKNPRHFTALFYLGDLEIALKHFTEAQEILKGLLKTDPSAIWVQQALKKAELGPLLEQVAQLKKQGHDEEAIDLLKKELAQSHDLELYLALAKLYRDARKYPEAISLLNEGLKRFPSDNSLNLNLGFTYLSENDFDHAKYIFTNILNIKTDHSEALTGLARIAFLTGKTQEAEELYAEAYQLNPLSTLTLSFMGEMKMAQEKYREAQALFKEVYRLDPEAIWAKQAANEAQVAPYLKVIEGEEKQGNFEKVKALYNDLINRFPYWSNNYLRFARFYREQKNYKKSIETLLEGLRAIPWSTPLSIALGHDYRLAGEYQQSEDILQQTLKQAPNNPEVLAEIGRLYADKNNYALASEYYQKSLRIDPRNLTALSYSVDLAIKQKHYGTAEKFLHKILKITPDATWAKDLLVRAHFGPKFDAIYALEKEGRQDEARLKLEKLLAVAPLSSDVYVELGQIYRSMNKYSEALELYQKGLELIPGANQLRIGLGLTYLDLHEWKRAKLQLEKAHQIDPKNGDALTALGKLYFLKGDKNKALHLYQQAVKLNPSHIFALSSLASFWMNEKQFDKAKQIYEKIEKIAPHTAWASQGILEATYGPLLAEASDKESHKDYEGAAAIYKHLLMSVPDQAIFYVKLGNLYRKAGRFPEAESIYNLGSLLWPNSIDLSNGLGFLYLDENKETAAKKAFEKVLALQPDNAEALAGIGRFYELSGNAQQAVQNYKKALDNHPNNITALIFLSDLMLKEGKFPTAQRLYKKIYAINTHENKWALLASKDAKHGVIFEEIKEKTKARDYKEVERLWRLLLKEEPSTTAYYIRFGLFYQYIKAYDKAIDVFSEGIKINPHSTELEAGLGLAYLSKKDLLLSEKAFNQALQLDPKNPDALAGLGYIAMLKNNTPQAELLIKTALAIDPERIAALSAYGDLLLKEKKYPEAADVYRKMVALRPEESVFKLSLEDAIYGEELDEIQELIKNDQFAEAAEKYTYLLQQSPDNVNFFYGLGQMYMRLHQYGKSIEVNLRGLEKNPESNALLIALGYDYFFNKHLVEARAALETALSVDEKDPEAVAGLGRVDELEGNFCGAEALYLYALQLDPKNLSALSFYGNFLLKQKRYNEAQAVYAHLWEVLPNAVWVQQAWQDAVDGPVTNIANRLSNQEEFELAARLYSDLIDASPYDPARYLALGETYANLQEYCCALETYFEGLDIDAKVAFLWRGVGFTYILQEEFDAAEEIFTTLLEEDDEDTESWAGLGRIQALAGSYCAAEEYYYRALEIDPKNLNTLSFLSELYQNEEWNFSSFITNYKIGQVIENDPAFAEESWPKWAIRSYNNSLNLIRPTLFLSGLYHEEDEWEPTLHRWSAEYQVYGGKALIKYPVCNGFTIWGSAADQFYNLKDLINHKYFYSFDVQRFALGSRWVCNSCFYIDAALGFTNYSPYRKSTFNGKTDWITEPTLVMTYHTPTSKATLGVLSNSDLVARNFKQNKAKMVGYYTFAGTYERKIMQRGWAGVEADFILYNDYVQNSSERVSGWLQWRPPCYSDNFVFRYYTKFQTFAKNIPDYYTYKPQYINQLQGTWEKRWRVCWADTFYTSLSYSHGWQNTRTRFRQIIVIVPSPVQQPFSWDNREFNTVVGTMIYKRGALQGSLTADYYRDTEKYTMWTIAGELGWSF